MITPPKHFPAVGQYIRRIGTLVDIVTPPPPPPPPSPPSLYVFEAITARTLLRHRNGEVLKVLGDYWDHGGEDRSTEECIEEAPRHCSRYAVTADGELEIVVIRTRTRRLHEPSEKENPYARDWQNFECLEIGSAAHMPDPTEEVAWSSRTDLKAEPTTP